MSVQPSQSADLRPASDVSAITGWLGLGALTVYVMICHFWPEIVVTFGLPSRVERLTEYRPHAGMLINVAILRALGARRRTIFGAVLGAIFFVLSAVF